MASKFLEACQNQKAIPKTPFVFENFLSQGSIKGLMHGPFRENIRLFLRECSEIQEFTVSGMPIWTTLLISEGVDFPLYTIEETVENSSNPFCDNCKLTGWGHHFVTKRKYHFIIPGSDHFKKQLMGDIFELRTHILYGLIHCNGYGHLICINGRKGDSDFLSDTLVMDFWDRLCSLLRTREISVHDDTNLRLLFLVVNGQPWYGSWGYEFSRGNFGVTKEQYETAIEYLKSLGLEKIVSDFKRKEKGRKIRQIIDKYRKMGDVRLITLRDLFRLMMEIQSRARIRRKTDKKMIGSARQDVIKRRQTEEPISSDKLTTSLGKNCRWPAKRIKFVLNQIVTVLKKNQASDGGKACISRHELREEIRKCVGDTGLIDFVLKSVTCFTMGNHIVCRSTNPSTKRFEFNIHKVLEGEGVESKWVPSYAINSGCKEREEGIELAAEVIVNILKENNGQESIRPRHELQDKARECIDDTEQVDFVVNSISSSLITNEMVSCPKSQLTKGDEVAVRDIIKNDRIHIEECNVVRDALYLCRNLLFSYSDSDAVRHVWDSKNFVKEWCHEEQYWNQLMAAECKVLPSFEELETELKRPLSPGETVLVSPSMTIRELKVVAQAAFRDTYCIMSNFVVSQIGGLKEIDPDKVVSITIEPGMPVWVRGAGLDLDTKLRYEDGHQELDVNCTCSTKCIDGERLSAWDICQVSEYTRWRGISDHEPAPVHFLCSSSDAVLVRK